MQIILQWLNTLPGAAAQGLVWGLMAIGLYITYKILDVADLTVDGSICTGAAVCTVLLTNGVNIWICMIAALIAGMLVRYPCDPCGNSDTAYALVDQSSRYERQSEYCYYKI